MIRRTVREVAERAGIRNAHELVQRAGLSVTTAYQLWEGTAKRLDLTTLDRLCALFDVPPGQLFERVKDRPSR
ncbi:MAG: helix-turn-helix domain-containing protein [Blastocatellia bacterium]